MGQSRAGSRPLPMPHFRAPPPLPPTRRLTPLIPPRAHHPPTLSQLTLGPLRTY